MIRLTDLDEEHLKEISHAFAESFLSQTGSLSMTANMYEAEIYFDICLKEYARAGVLYALSEKEEGYIVFHRKNKGIRWYRDLYMTWQYMMRLTPSTMQRMILARNGWQSYEVTHANDPDYLDVELVCVRKEYQGQGLLRKMLKEPFAEADAAGIPCILDTDAEHKAMRYEHVGMRIERHAVLSSGLHLYTMIYGGRNK